jgi:hypothetical protein
MLLVTIIVCNFSLLIVTTIYVCNKMLFCVAASIAHMFTCSRINLGPYYYCRDYEDVLCVQ